MKKRKSKKNNTANRIRITQKPVDVQGKKDVVLMGIEKKLTEDEIRVIVEQLVEENKKMKKKYYSVNTPIMVTQSRSFGQLVEKFLDRIESTLKEKGDERLNRRKGS